ncbi:MAG: hypothetical protein JW806_06410 [Sedimentisphaerales bacterium]|nr:hypothetical protein [Sedimentisphaerales bacterium]
MREYRNMSRIVLLTALTVIFAAQLSAQPPYGNSSKKRLSREERRQALEQESHNAIEEITDGYRELVDLINSGQIPSEQELKQAYRTTVKNKKYLPVLDDPEKIMYHTLAAWVYHFDQKYDKALKQIDAASNIAAQDPDVLKTYFALSVIYADYESAIGALIKNDTSNPEQEESEESEESQEPDKTMETEYIELDVNSVQIKLLGKTFDFKPDPADSWQHQRENKSACILLWSFDPDELDKFEIIEPNEPNKPDDPNDPNMPKTPKPEPASNSKKWKIKGAPEIEDFSNLQNQFEKDQEICFAGFNLNSPDKKKNIKNWLRKNPQSWQLYSFSDEQKQKMFSYYETDFNKPTLLILTPDNTIRYAGRFEGFLPGMILNNILKNSSETGFADTDTSPAEPKDTDIHESAESAAAKTEEQPQIEIVKEQPPKPAETEKKQPKKPVEASNQMDEDFFEPQAETLLESARTFFKISKKLPHTSYQKPVDMCRRVIKDYPNTKYVQQAQILMRQVPPQYRKMYNITDEELGL